MARIRSIHPGLFTDEQFMSASVYARLLLPGLWVEAWDDGVIEWRPLRLKARIFPNDSVDVELLLQELTALEFIKPFEVDGRKYAAIHHFRKWQSPKSPNSSNVLPSDLHIYVGLPHPIARNSEIPSDESAEFRNDSGNASEPLENDFRNASPKCPQKGGREEGRKEEGKESKRTPPSAPPLPVDASQAEPAPRPPEQTRLGSRLPENWQPGPELRQFAADLGLSANAVADQFRDYWHGVAGQKGRKADWPATWRNWCRRSAESAKNSQKPPFASRPGKLDWLRADLGFDVSNEFDGVTVEAAMGHQLPNELPLSASTLAQECPLAMYSAPPLKSA